MYIYLLLGDFSSLDDDGYVFWNLVHHMLEAKQQGEAMQLLTNLAWVTKKLEVCGPADIINDYIKINELVQKKEVDEHFTTLNNILYLPFIKS
jgi:hypothetical protein